MINHLDSKINESVIGTLNRRIEKMEGALVQIGNISSRYRHVISTFDHICALSEEALK